MIAVVPVRDGVLPAGGDEAIAECGGRVIVAGSGTDAVELSGLACDATLVELGPFAPGRWSEVLAAAVDGLPANEIVVLPASADGRDLAPRLALALDRPLHAGATEVAPTHVRVARNGGRELVEHPLTGPVVATLQPGVRGVVPVDAPVVVHEHASALRGVADGAGHDGSPPDPTVVAVLPPDVATMDLAEAARIVGGGAGLDGAIRFRQLERIAAALGATVGATRVITDRAWLPHERQIGTTGVVVDPDLYVAFGISGAVQHTSGLGDPDHIVSVNTDAFCPMMQMSDLAIVSDANAVLDGLVTLLADTARPADTDARTADTADPTAGAADG